MNSGWRFLLNRLRERLWVRPLVVCVLSIGVALLARLADDTGLGDLVISITAESLATLLQVMASSMLVIATFAVGSMVSAYASASGNATPRSFRVVIADDVSQNALSTFVGAFIFSIVALVAIQNGYFGEAGRFVLLSLTLLVFAGVVVTFVRWVDNIARLGRLGPIVRQVEAAAMQALCDRRTAPSMGGVAPGEADPQALEVFGASIGYVQRVDVAALQACAEEADLHITVNAQPGAFATPVKPLALVAGDADEAVVEQVRAAFTIGVDRTFDEDPRFGLIVLSEIASRALSPGVNDPGTAIDVLGSFVRLFAAWGEGPAEAEVQFPRVAVAALDLDDLFDDAFTGIARDGAGCIEVLVRLMKTLEMLAGLGDDELRTAALHHARLALERADAALEASQDQQTLRAVAAFARD